MATTIYLRTSTEEQNPQNQLRDCQSINTYGIAEVIEEKQSAWKDKDRPKLNELKKRVSQRKLKHLIVWDWDRLFRNRLKLKEFFQFCKVFGCEIHSYRQKFFEDFYNIPAPFDDIMQELVLNLLGWMAEDESKKKSERVRAAFKKSTKKWGRRPLKGVDKQIKELHSKGESVRDIASKVYYWDSSRNKKFVSKSYVHKIIQRFKLISS